MFLQIHVYITVELKEENEKEFINLFESLECAHSFHLALIGGYEDETINVKRLVAAMHGVKSVKLVTFTFEKKDEENKVQ